jgi:uncharacterized repeat protein (TIGR02543 family)
LPDNPTKSGYAFDGWYASTGGAGAQFTATTTVTGDLRVYAKWTVAQCTVTFNADGGSPATQTRTASSGSAIGASTMPADPTKRGYGFGGWHTEVNGGGTKFTAATTVTEDITVYAKWLEQYTVTFNADGGSPGTQTRTVNDGSSVGASNMPDNPTKSGYVFGGWHTSTGGSGAEFTAITTVDRNITVYANWTTMPTMPTTSLQDALDWLAINAEEEGEYTIALNANETIAPRTLSYGGKQVRITLKGDTSERRVVLSSNGSLFTVESGVTLTLDNNITLQGRGNNTDSLIQVNNGGTLTMNTGSKITGNTKNAVNINYGGGGVLVYGGTFTMSGGSINGNTAFASYLGGGGVHVWSGTFTMSGGTINGNTTSSRGGGVCVGNSVATFMMSGGTISDNYVTATAENAASYGGGVYVATGAFMMSGGIVSGNSAYSGGGVYLLSGTFTKQSDCAIYGSNASSRLTNTATTGDSHGHAVYIYASPAKKRDTTAGTGVTLNSAVGGSAGGWE